MEMMNATRVALRRSAVLPKQLKPFSAKSLLHKQDNSSSSSSSKDGHVDVEQLLSQPTWSVASLLPSKTPSMDAPQVSSKQLHHLLRLSALPPPRDAEDEAKMLSTLSSQLHFVEEIRKVDTSVVEPLRSLRDETKEGEKEAELGMDALKEALGQEEVRGRYHKRIRRRRNEAVQKQEEDWDVLGTAERKVGRFFVVEGGKHS